MEAFFPESLDPVFTANLTLCLFWCLLAFDPNLPPLKITNQLIHRCLRSVVAAFFPPEFSDPLDWLYKTPDPPEYSSSHPSLPRLRAGRACSLHLRCLWYASTPSFPTALCIYLNKRTLTSSNSSGGKRPDQKYMRWKEKTTTITVLPYCLHSTDHRIFSVGCWFRRSFYSTHTQNHEAPHLQ